MEREVVFDVPLESIPEEEVRDLAYENDIRMWEKEYGSLLCELDTYTLCPEQNAEEIERCNRRLDEMDEELYRITKSTRRQ